MAGHGTAAAGGPRIFNLGVAVEDAGATDHDDTLGCSQASSLYGFAPEDDITDVIKNFSTQPTTSTQPTSNTSSQDAGSSFDQVPSTQITAGSSTRTLTATASLNLGKRKYQGSALSSPGSPTKKPFQQSRSDSNLPLPAPIFTRAEVLLSTFGEDPVNLTWQAFMDGLLVKLPYGVQWELSRHITSRLGALNAIKFTDITVEDARVLNLEPKNKTAVPAAVKYIINKLMTNGDEPGSEEDSFAAPSSSREPVANSPWEELDLEEDALNSDNSLANLGFAEDDTRLGHYGGKVEFRGSLHVDTVRKDTNNGFRVRLEPVTLGPSTQMARFYGSKNIFRLKLTKSAEKVDPDKLMAFLKRPLYICGGVFRAFYAKESNVFFARTNESIGVKSAKPDHRLLSYLEFVSFHNDIALNGEQAMAKYASRFALALSNSAPGILLKSSQIRFMDDITNPETGSCMTDGAGSLNRVVTSKLYREFGWDERPTAIQVRVYGSKGLLVDNRDEPSTKEPIIYLTPSQIKIKYREDCHPVHRIIDVLRASHTKTSCRLSVETIINLHENGVPATAFTELLKKSIADLVVPLLDWNADDADFTLWCIAQKLGGVLAQRKARENVGQARLKGFSERDLDENEPDDEDGFTQLDLGEQRSTTSTVDPVSGCPYSLYETVMELLDSGFKPAECLILRDKLKNIIKNGVRGIQESYRLEVPMSCSAWIVPDISGVLQEGEVFFKSSRRNLMRPDGTETDELLGCVIVTRHPCKHPTDAQKWKAVYHEALRHLVDVVVISTRGSRRGADLLAGGDYDGDKVMMMWDPLLVEPFSNAPLHYAEPPDAQFRQDNFVEENISVAEFVQEIAELPEVDQIHAYQEHLLRAIRDTSVVGQYSNFHLNAVYQYGYGHAKAWRLGHMFCMTLDGSKTGLRVKPEVLAEDLRNYNHRAPAWKESDEDKEKAGMSNKPNLKRPKTLKKFIMDELHDQGKKEANKWLKKLEDHYEQYKQRSHLQMDDDLAGPYYELKRLSEADYGEGLRIDLEVIETLVKSVYCDHRQELSNRAPDDPFASPRKRGSPHKSPRKGGADFSKLPLEKRQDIIRSLSRRFAASPHNLHMPLEQYHSAMASFAYVYDFTQHKLRGGTQFPFDVAFARLCEIKAKASGRWKTVTRDFYEKYNIKYHTSYAPPERKL